MVLIMYYKVINLDNIKLDFLFITEEFFFKLNSLTRLCNNIFL